MVVVTGASSGIGRATALAFAEECAKTVLFSRSLEKLEAVADEIRASGGEAFVAPDGLARRKARIEVHWQPRLLMFAQALSPRLGDLFVRLLQTRIFGRLFGTFRGRTYQHG